MDPDLAGFIGLAALMVTLVAWLRIDMNGRMDRLETAQGERLTRIEATLSEHGATLSAHGERLIRIEATQHELRERMDGLDAELHAARADLSRINERMAHRRHSGRGPRTPLPGTHDAPRGRRSRRIVPRGVCAIPVRDLRHHALAFETAPRVRGPESSSALAGNRARAAG